MAHVRKMRYVLIVIYLLVLVFDMSYAAPIRGRRSNFTRKNTFFASEMYDIYLNTLRDALTGKSLQTPGIQIHTGESGGDTSFFSAFNDIERDLGSSWCSYCYTMAGTGRLNNARRLIENVIKEGVNGDFLEAGAWRGGVSIFSRAVQRANGEGATRSVFVCDSFGGLPKASNPTDDNVWSRMKFLSVNVDEVRDHFRRFLMLDDNVHFVKGFFQHALPPLRKKFLSEDRKIAVLRGDGDMYESYLDILYNLYEFVPLGGWFICDDCPVIAVANAAINDFRSAHNITEPIQFVAGSATGSYWQKKRHVDVDYGWYVQWNRTRTPA